LSKKFSVGLSMDFTVGLGLGAIIGFFLTSTFWGGGPIFGRLPVLVNPNEEKART
jgi:hypothetical protein